MSLYTKQGVPLRVEGGRVYNPAGENFGQVSGDRVYDLRSRYRGTIVGDRLIHRSTDSAAVVSASMSTANQAGSAQAHQAGSALWGDEPNIRP